MFMFKYERERREKDLNVMGARKETEFEDKERGRCSGQRDQKEGISEQGKRKLEEGRGAEAEKSRGEVGREHSSTCAV